MTEEEFAAHFKLGEHANVQKDVAEARLASERQTMFYDIAPLKLPDYGMFDFG